MPFNQAMRKNSHILWTISLIQDITPEAQTKAEFTEMTGDVVNTDTIDKTTLCLADTLQRFRFMIQDGLTEEEATIKCQEMAKTWHLDNAESLDKLKETKKLEILTWDEFLNWSEYEKTVKDVERFYKENNKFSRDVDGRVRQELNKIKSDAKVTDRTQQIELLKKYLFEECAFQKFASSKYFDYELYKNPFTPAMRDIKNNENFVNPKCMVELYFTQFNNPPKNKPENKVENKVENKPLVQNYYTPTNLIPYGNIPVGIDFPPMYSHTRTYYYPSESSINNRNSFMPVFNNSPKTIDIKEFSNSTDVKTAEQSRIEFADFIEKSLKMLPEKEQKKAIESLVKFTTNEILPLYYTTDKLKI